MFAEQFMALAHGGFWNVTEGFFAFEANRQHLSRMQPVQSEACSYKCHRTDFVSDIDGIVWLNWSGGQVAHEVRH